MTTRKEKSRVSSQDIYNELKGMILSFELYPGSRVTETELADRFQVSRTPVREALQRLEMDGCLVIRPKQGCFIRDVDIIELTQYYDVRIALEMHSLRGACMQMSDKELEQLAVQWDPDSQKGRSDVVDTMVDLEESFHITLAAGSGNDVLVKYLQDINNRIRIIRRLDFTEKARLDRTYRDHFEIVQYLLQRDLEGAQLKMRQHILKSAEFAKNLTLTQLAQKRRLRSA